MASETPFCAPMKGAQRWHMLGYWVREYQSWGATTKKDLPFTEANLTYITDGMKMKASTNECKGQADF